MDVKVAALLVACACSSKGARSVEDARKPAPPPSDVAAIDATTPAPTTPTPTPAPPTTGDLSIRVEWVDVPVAARTSPGTTACGTPLPAAVAPTTTWGIPDVLVQIEGLDRDAGETTVRLADCLLSPRIAVGSALVVESAMARPARVTIKGDGGGRPVQLPIAGHAVRVEVADGARHELVTDGSSKARGTANAWVVDAAGAVTDASGVAQIRDVPPATYKVRAWLPPRAGQAAREATGEITVGAGELGELTLKL